jgi:DNA replication and repair protein RecF
MEIYLSGFRNLKARKIAFLNFPIFIYGPNGSGKTSILEALYFLSTSKSFRHHQKDNLINFKVTQAILELQINKKLLRVNLYPKAKNEYYLKSKHVPRYQFINQILTEVFWWGDFKLAYGEPQERRRFLNLLCLQVEPTYLQYLSLYNKILKERKFALTKNDKNLLDIWDKKMAVVASKLYQTRQKTLVLLNENLGQTIEGLRPRFKNPQVEYKGKFLGKEEFLVKLKKSRQLDLQDLKTHFGPHRDDLKFLWANPVESPNSSTGQKVSLKNFSQGEVKSFLLGLKLNFLFNLPQKEKYFLIDDCLAEIDRDVILNLIKISKERKINLILTHQSEPNFKFKGKIIKL